MSLEFIIAKIFKARAKGRQLCLSLKCLTRVVIHLSRATVQQGLGHGTQVASLWLHSVSCVGGELAQKYCLV